MSECTIKTIFEKLIGNSKSYTVNKDKTEIFVPAKRFTKAGAYKIAERMHNKAIKEFGVFGKNTSLNTTYTDGTAVNIHPTKLLDEAYDIKEGLKEVTTKFTRDVDFFNGDEALYEQETNNVFNVINEYNLSLQNEKEIILHNVPFFVAFQNTVNSRNNSTNTGKGTNPQSGNDLSNRRGLYDGRAYYIEILENVNISKLEKIQKTIQYIQSELNNTSGLVGKINNTLNPRILIAKDDDTPGIFMQLGNNIIINPTKILELLYKNVDLSQFPNYIDNALLEELIHVKANEKLTKEKINVIYNELSKKDLENIQKYYTLNLNNVKLNESQIVNEYIRQIVQYKLNNSTTEDNASQLYKLTKSTIDFLKSLFQDIINIYNNKQDSVGSKTIDEIILEIKNIKEIINEKNNTSPSNDNTEEQGDREELPFIDDEQAPDYQENNVIDENLVDPKINQKFEEMLKNGIISEICN